MAQKSNVVLVPVQGKVPKIGDVISHSGGEKRVLDIIGNVKKPYLVVRR